MAKGTHCAVLVVLGGCEEDCLCVWEKFRKLVEDVLDNESVSATLGKPGGADLSLPVLHSMLGRNAQKRTVNVTENVWGCSS